MLKNVVGSGLSILGFLSLLGGCTDKSTGQTVSSDLNLPSTTVHEVVPISPTAPPLGVLVARTAEEKIVIERAIEKLTIPCMEAQGFPFFSNIPGATAALAIPEVPYGQLLLERAQKYGYHPPPSEPTGNDLSEIPSGAVDLQKYAAALNGDPADTANLINAIDDRGNVLHVFNRGGCRGKAELQVVADWGKLEGYRETIETAIGESLGQAFADPRWSEVMAKWSACMKTAGFNYQTIDEPVGQVATGPSATELEIQTAVADARCREDTQLLTVLNSINWARQLSFTEEHPTVVPEYQALWSAAVRHAAELIG